MGAGCTRYGCTRHKSSGDLSYKTDSEVSRLSSAGAFNTAIDAHYREQRVKAAVSSANASWGVASGRCTMTTQTSVLETGETDSSEQNAAAIVGLESKGGEDQASIGDGLAEFTPSLGVLRQRFNSTISDQDSDDSACSKIALLEDDAFRKFDFSVDMETTEASYACSLKLRSLMRKIYDDSINKQEILRCLDQAAKVLEHIYDEETRRLCGDEEDELSVATAQSETMPSEVREWLASTFTRTMSSMSRTHEKRRFRSVATVIRAGLMVERLYRRASLGPFHIAPHVIYALKSIHKWEFDVFQLSEASEGRPLRHVMHEMLQHYDVISKFRIPLATLDCFINQIEAGYQKFGNPYHNHVHAADVTQATMHFIMDSGLADLLSDLELFATIIASAVHDFEHTGTTNAFHVNTRSDYALVYNDKSILENYHISSTFRILRDTDCNIIANLSNEEYTEFRSLVIELILATDMAFHFAQIKTMKSLLAVGLADKLDKTKSLAFLLHVADIGHPGKAWPLHKKWTGMLVNEFFRQGDRERELGVQISPLCDRNTVLVPDSQIGFINFIVEPAFNVVGDIMDIVAKGLTDSDQATTVTTNEGGNTAARSEPTTARQMSDIKEESKESMSDLEELAKTSSKSSSVTGKRPWNGHIAANKERWRKISEEDKLAREEAERLKQTTLDPSAGGASPSSSSTASAVGSGTITSSKEEALLKKMP